MQFDPDPDAIDICMVSVWLFLPQGVTFSIPDAKLIQVDTSLKEGEVNWLIGAN